MTSVEAAAVPDPDTPALDENELIRQELADEVDGTAVVILRLPDLRPYKAVSAREYAEAVDRTGVVRDS